MRKNCTRFKPSVPKHNQVSLAQTCRHSGHANRDRLMTSTRYISTACTAIHVPCRGSGSKDSDIHTKLFTSGEKTSLQQVTRTIMGSWRATHQGCYMAGQMPQCTSATVWWHDACVHGSRAPERQGAARAAIPVHTALGLCLTHTIGALREELQASVSCSGRAQPCHGSLTDQHPRHLSLEDVTNLQCSMAFSRNLVHVATMQEGAVLMSYLISKSCVPDAEVNPLLSP